MYLAIARRAVAPTTDDNRPPSSIKSRTDNAPRFDRGPGVPLDYQINDDPGFPRAPVSVAGQASKHRGGQRRWLR